MGRNELVPKFKLGLLWELKYLGLLCLASISTSIYLGALVRSCFGTGFHNVEASRDGDVSQDYRWSLSPTLLTIFTPLEIQTDQILSNQLENIPIQLEILYLASSTCPKLTNIWMRCSVFPAPSIGLELCCVWVLVESRILRYFLGWSSHLYQFDPTIGVPETESKIASGFRAYGTRVASRTKSASTLRPYLKNQS